MSATSFLSATRLAVCTFAVALLSIGSAPTVVHAQAASLVGKVLSDSAEKPLANAEITLNGASQSTRSDSAGQFQLSGIKAGKYELVIRLVGYEPVSTTLTFGATQKIEGDFLLKPLATQLARVDVKDRKPIANIRLAQFDENRKSAGRFLTADEFEKAGGRPLATILTSKFPGMRVNRTNGREVMTASRDARDCFMNVFLNNINVSRVGPFDLSTINSTDVMGVEYYSPPQTPQKYNLSGAGNGSGCSTLVIWTRS